MHSINTQKIKVNKLEPILNNADHSIDLLPTTAKNSMEEDERKPAATRSNDSDDGEERMVAAVAWSGDSTASRKKRKVTFAQASDDSTSQTTAQEDPRRRPSGAEARNLRHERLDIQSALEHITVIGNVHRHRQWRINHWNWIQDQQKNNTEGIQKEQDAEQITSRLPAHFVHGEDVRLYGASGRVPAQPWPNSSSTPINDSQWELEHGDQIHPLEFAKAYLSGVFHEVEVQVAAADTSCVPMKTMALPTETTEAPGPFEACMETEALLEPSRVNSIDPERWKETLDPSEVPRDMVLRCWQRAMDAATFSTLQQMNKREEPNSDVGSSPTCTGPGSNNDGSTSTLQRLEQQKSVKDRCRDLPLKVLESDDSHANNNSQSQQTSSCTICGLDLDTRDKLVDHVYGTEQQIACCWPLLHDRQRSLISDVLEEELKSQAKTLMHLIFKKAKERMEEQSDGNNNWKPSTRSKTTEAAEDDTDDILEHKPIFHWSDILDMLRETLSSSSKEKLPIFQELNNNEHPSTGVADTLDVHKSLAPLVLNEQVLDAVSYRLTQRYAAVQY